MVHFHVLNYEIVRLFAAEHIFDVGKPFLTKILVHSVHDCNLVVQNRIRIVSHSRRNIELPFKKVDFMVVNADIFD